MDHNASGRTNQCGHFRLKNFFCQICRTKTCQKCLKIFHKIHRFRLDFSYMNNLKSEKIAEWNKNFDGVIEEIKKARISFLKDVSAINVKISSEGNKFNQVHIIALLRIVKEIEMIQIRKWRNQEEKCLTLRKEWNREAYLARSVLDLNLLIEKMMFAFERVMFVELCKLYKIDQGAGLMRLGGIRMSPSAAKTKVKSNGTFFLNEINNCTVEVKNEINEVVENDVKYNISVRMVDEEGQSVHVMIKNEKNGCFNIMYYPTSPHPHLLFVSVNSIPVNGTPLKIVLESHSNRNHVALTFGSPGTGDGQFAQPWGVCCDSDGKIYVADRLNHRIQIFGSNGRFIRKFGGNGDRPGEFNRPAGIAVDSLRRIIVADKDNNRIQIFRSDGEYLNHFGRFETDEESLSYPWGVAVNQLDQIAVTEGKRHQVRLFTAEGIRLAECVFAPEMQLSFPRGIASLPNGSFLVTDFEKHKIVYLDDKFQPFSTLGSRGQNIEHFYRPQSIAVSRNGMIAISDCRNKRIKIYRRDGMIDGIANCFQSPQGIAFNVDGSLIVVDSSENVVKIFDYTKIYPSDCYFANSTNCIIPFS